MKQGDQIVTRSSLEWNMISALLSEITLNEIGCKTSGRKIIN